MATIAKFYSQNLAQNLAQESLKGLTQKARMGGTPGKAPVGYLNVIQRIDGRDIRTVMVDDERAPHVVWAFEAYASGDYTMRESTEGLKARGLRSRATPKVTSRPLHMATVELMLKNPYYTGVVVFRGIQYPGRHEPIISPELFDRVQVIKAGRRLSKEKPSTTSTT